MTKPTFDTTLVISDQRIEITLDKYLTYAPTHDKIVQELEQIKKEILRHVDDVSSKTVNITWTTTQSCTHCLEPVELGTIDGVPHCCDAAQAEWLASGGTIPEY